MCVYWVILWITVAKYPSNKVFVLNLIHFLLHNKKDSTCNNRKISTEGIVSETRRYLTTAEKYLNLKNSILNGKLSTRVALQEKESIHIDLQNKPLKH